jgi:hypothetical protein
MLGDSDGGAWIIPVPYLSTCGTKKLKLEGHVWSNLCFEKVYTIEALCKTAPTCSAPVNPSANAPVQPPVKLPTKAPVHPTTNAHVQPPAKPPNSAPVKPPVKSPTSAPIKVRSPLCPPVPPPVLPPVCTNTYVSAANSKRIPNLQCYDSFQDCACVDGYIKMNGACVPKIAVPTTLSVPPIPHANPIWNATTALTIAPASLALKG